MSAAKILNKTNTGLPPCSIKYHPIHSNFIITGSYEYDPKTKTKTGSIDTFQLNKLNEFKLIDTIFTNSSILDLQFSPADDNLFITGHSTGEIIIWQTDFENEILLIEKIQTVQVFENDNLITSLRFSDTFHDKLLITSTKGLIAHLSLSSSNIESSIEILPSSHDLECWIGNFGNFEMSNIIFTGGDDCSFKAIDLRSLESVFDNNRIHDAGITSILTPTPGNKFGIGNWQENQQHWKIWTGSYDDCLKHHDLRFLNSDLLPYPPKTKESINLGGGVWKLIPFKTEETNDGKQKLLVCCMYDGARVVEYDAKDESFEVLKFLKKNHESMVYGGDTRSKDNLMITCSFYDKVVQLWDADLVE